MMETQGTYLLDTCICIALIKVTSNTHHFERIPDLRIENWMEA